MSNARSTASIDSRTTSAWRVIGLSWWWALSHCIASDGRAICGHRLGELERQRVDDLDVALGEPGEHRRQLGERPRAGLEADALAALARVVELELVLLRDDLFGHPGAGRRALGGLRGLSGSPPRRFRNSRGTAPPDASRTGRAAS